MTVGQYEISDVIKIAAMLLVYTVYITWWASGVSTKLESMAHLMEEHVHKNEHPISQTQAIVALTKVQEAQNVLIGALNNDHIRCKIIIEQIIERLDNLEELENLAHGRNHD